MQGPLLRNEREERILPRTLRIACEQRLSWVYVEDLYKCKSSTERGQYTTSLPLSETCPGKEKGDYYFWSATFRYECLALQLMRVRNKDRQPEFASFCNQRLRRLRSCILPPPSEGRGGVWSNAFFVKREACWARSDRGLTAGRRYLASVSNLHVAILGLIMRPIDQVALLEHSTECTVRTSNKCSKPQEILKRQAFCAVLVHALR